MSISTVIVIYNKASDYVNRNTNKRPRSGNYRDEGFRNKLKQLILRRRP
jgi:hypothetical protein